MKISKYCKNCGRICSSHVMFGNKCEWTEQRYTIKDYLEDLFNWIISKL